MMPVVFIGHGSPMNAIENNEYTRDWKQIAATIPKPEAILVVSAHWYISQSVVSAVSRPEMIYDFYGFPKELYRIEYRAPGSPELSQRVAQLLGGNTAADDARGLDHGAWIVLSVMYPQADIPVVQLSVNSRLSAQTVFDIGGKFRELRKSGVLIMGSGNIVHNLTLADFSMSGGYGWADEFDNYIFENIKNNSYEKVIDYKSAGACADRAFFTPDHFYPLLYVLGAADKADSVTVYNNSRMAGALSMTSYLFSARKT